MSELTKKEKFHSIMEFINSNLDNYEVIVTLNCINNSLTRFANNIIHQNVSQSSNSLSIKVIKDKKVGESSTNTLTNESVLKTLENAKLISSYAPPDKEFPELLGKQDKKYRETSSYCAKTESLSPEFRANIVSKAVNKCKENKLNAAGIVKNSVSEFFMANSKGLNVDYKSTQIDFDLSVYNENSTSGWARGNSFTVESVDFDKIIDSAVSKALLANNPIEMEAGEYTVILEPAAVADLVMFMAFMCFGAQSYLDGTSSLNGKLGKKVVGDNITITDNAYHPLSVGMPFDFEGTPRQEITLVENGIAKNLVQSQRTAKKMDTVTTGHALPEPSSEGPIPLNIVFKPGTKTYEELIKSTDKGILVTHFHYVNIVDPNKLSLTGMTRDGLFLIENGEVTKAIKNFRFTESVFKALSNVVEMTESLHLFNSWWMSLVVPAMKINNFRFSSKTDF